MKTMDLDHLKISFLGGGNMARAMISGLLHKGIQPQNLLAIDPLPTARHLLSDDFKIRTASDVSQAENFLQTSHVLVLCVKPQQLQEALTQLRKAFVDLSEPKILVFSIVAGVQIKDITVLLGHNLVVRGMPNTPALIQKGITGLFKDDSLNASDIAMIELICEAIGTFVWFNQESQLDIVTALSGSGPAYLFLLIEHLIKSGQDQGLSFTQAKLLATHTVIGSGLLALQSHDDPAILRERVTSKGGTTFAALEVLNNHHWGKTLEVAVQAAADRAKEMGDAFGKS